MKSVLEEIYYGERGNVDAIEPSKEYAAASSKYADLMEKLSDKLTEQQQKELLETFFTSAEAENAANLTFFKEGFKLGMQIAIEVLI